jgi:AcrR family transcriptional regulator
MARPKGADGEATRRRILAAARALVAERGIDGTSTRDVADAAGVNVATLAHHFGSKDGLHQACIEDMYEELGTLSAQFAEVLAQDPTPEQLLEQAIRKTFAFARAHRPGLRMLMRLVVDRGEQLPGKIDQHLAFLEQVSVFLEAGGTPKKQGRLIAQSTVHLVVRYALTSDEELKQVVGTKSLATAEAAIADHLVRLLRAALAA